MVVKKGSPNQEDPFVSPSGYEKYNTMRADPTLCFLEKAGRPDDKAIAAEHRLDAGEG